MAPLPISRVVDVTITRLDRFPVREGFGIPLVLTNEADRPVDTTNRTKVYSSTESMTADGWESTDDAYQTVETIFGQNPRPRQAKVGWVNFTGPTMTTWATEMDLLNIYDDNWYWGLISTNMRDTASIDDLLDWFEARNKILFLDSNAATMINPTDVTNVASRNKGLYDRTAVFYHSIPEHYFAAGASGYTARRNFDAGDSAYTLKFKKVRTIPPINIDSAKVEAITGFVPAIGLDTTVGHMANCYVNIGGVDMIVEGTVLSGAFVDEIHTSDWMVARVQEELLGILTNVARVPMTDTGVHQLVSGVEAVMMRAYGAGLIADVIDEETGEVLPSFEFDVDRVLSISAAQRRQRISPDIRCTFRYAGAIHYVTVNLFMTF